MLYQVFDKNGRPYDKIECEPWECDLHLRDFPEFGAPYSAHAILNGKQKVTHKYRAISVRHPHGTGIVLGVIGSGPIYYGVLFILRHWHVWIF